MRRVLLLLTVVAMVVMSAPAYAFHQEGHTGGDTPDDRECNPSGQSCNGGGGGTFEDPNSPTGFTHEGSGTHYVMNDEGDYIIAGGGGGYRIDGGGGYGGRCEGNAYDPSTQDCNGNLL